LTVRQARAAGCSFEDRGPDADFPGARRAAAWAGAAWRAHAFVRRAETRRPNGLPDVSASGIRRGAEPVSRCRGASEEPFDW